MHQSDDLGARILKVNHADENGAVNIYRGQLLAARLTVPGMVEELAQFKQHEESHRAIFCAELVRRNRSRCRSYGLCGIGGFALGLLTGLLGRQAIAATTVAVERVVLRHLLHQVEVLQHQDEAAVAAIKAIIDDERHHHDQSAIHVQTHNILVKLLSPVMSASTEAVIWLGMRL